MCMSFEAKKTTCSTRAARGIFGSVLPRITPEWSSRRLSADHCALFTTRHVSTRRMHFGGRNTSRPRTESVISDRAAVITSQAKEGFERSHLQEKLQFYNVARGSAGEVRSLLYVISDNYPRSAPEAECLRSAAISVGKLVSGLLQSTEARKGKLPRTLSILLAPISHLLSPSFHLPLSPR